MTFREGHYICEAIWETGLLVALDLMVGKYLSQYISALKLNILLQEVNPSLEDDVSVKQTVAVGCSLVRAALGKSITFKMHRTSLMCLYDCLGETLL